MSNPLSFKAGRSWFAFLSLIISLAETKMIKTYNIDVPFDESEETEYLKYKNQIDILKQNNLITDEVALVTLSIIRAKLGLPSIVIYLVQHELDIITL